MDVVECLQRGQGHLQVIDIMTTKVLPKSAYCSNFIKTTPITYTYLEQNQILVWISFWLSTRKILFFSIYMYSHYESYTTKYGRSHIKQGLSNVGDKKFHSIKRVLVFFMKTHWTLVTCREIWSCFIPARLGVDWSIIFDFHLNWGISSLNLYHFHLCSYDKT